ncbi:hypothetical protein PLESTF_001676700 [Pleodorina starrii]|nr:hypothetical protein PLESTF_001676700 [Pleodorina starrii]
MAALQSAHQSFTSKASTAKPSPGLDSFDKGGYANTIASPWLHANPSIPAAVTMPTPLHPTIVGRDDILLPRPQHFTADTASTSALDAAAAAIWAPSAVSAMWAACAEKALLNGNDGSTHLLDATNMDATLPQLQQSPPLPSALPSSFSAALSMNTAAAAIWGPSAVSAMWAACAEKALLNGNDGSTHLLDATNMDATLPQLQQSPPLPSALPSSFSAALSMNTAAAAIWGPSAVSAMWAAFAEKALQGDDDDGGVALSGAVYSDATLPLHPVHPGQQSFPAPPSQLVPGGDIGVAAVYSDVVEDVPQQDVHQREWGLGPHINYARNGFNCSA